MVIWNGLPHAACRQYAETTTRRPRRRALRIIGWSQWLSNTFNSAHAWSVTLISRSASQAIVTGRTGIGDTEPPRQRLPSTR
jgi:hypothetical protein